jgi:hypothetical protein
MGWMMRVVPGGVCALPNRCRRAGGLSGDEMRSVWTSISQQMVMAAIVATLLWLPVGALLAWLCFGVLGISVHAFVTFGDALNRFQGVLAWWALGFLAALAYAGFLLPWDRKE